MENVFSVLYWFAMWICMALVASAPCHIHASLWWSPLAHWCQGFPIANLLCVVVIGCCALVVSTTGHIHSSLWCSPMGHRCQGFQLQTCSVWELLGVARSWHQHPITFMLHCGDHRWCTGVRVSQLQTCSVWGLLRAHGISTLSHSCLTVVITDCTEVCAPKRWALLSR